MYAAYKETEHSLWLTDKDRLFGEPHYHRRPARFLSASVWGDGRNAFEQKMAAIAEVGFANSELQKAITTRQFELYAAVTTTCNKYH